MNLTKTNASALPARGAEELWLFGVLFALMLGAVAFGAWAGFPVNDDAYLVLFLRETGVGSLAEAHPARPIYGILLEGVAGLVGLHRAPYVGIGIAFWALLAWQTNRLSRRLFPQQTTFGALAALLILAPILVSTQYTTVTTLIPANLPVSLSLAALLICLREGSERRPGALAAAMCFVAAAGTISEYGIATCMAAAALLWMLRRRRAAVFLSLGAAAGYLVFRAVGDLSVRPKQLPSEQLGKFFSNPLTGVFRLVEGVWSCLLGAYGTAAGAVRIDSESRSTILAALVGLAAAILIGRLCRLRRTAEAEEGAGTVFLGLALAVAAGLLPVVLANRSPVSTDPYESRYLLPVLPFAVITTAYGLHRVAVPRFRPWAAAILAFLAGYGAVTGAFGARNEQRRMEELGRALQPLVRASSGITVAVCPDRERLDGADMTPKVTWRWTDAEARRAWVMPLNEARPLFGTRASCRDTDRIDLPRYLLSTRRVGPLSHLVWVPMDAGFRSGIEPYCCGGAR